MLLHVNPEIRVTKSPGLAAADAKCFKRCECRNPDAESANALPAHALLSINAAGLCTA